MDIYHLDYEAPGYLSVHCQSMLHGSSGKNGGDSSYQQNSLEDSSRSGPYFDKSASKNVTALLGKTTYLNCRVKNLGNKTGEHPHVIINPLSSRNVHLRHTLTGLLQYEKDDGILCSTVEACNEHVKDGFSELPSQEEKVDKKEEEEKMNSEVEV
uniref:Uncharacterized protein n=1 Tax=Vespula pensylvanica TaxID=30213 RepID=A0A834P9Y4_VESPE|nr:hypothetical protein H0235_002381 [Vespula pensylvanica]